MCGNNSFFLLLIMGYLCGSVPCGLLFSKILGFGDIRKSGSGNIGATNALRTGGKLLGFLTLIFDAFKGVVAIWLSKYFCSDYLIQIFVGFAAILGHIFPIWLRFKGGKGVATSLAVIVTLNWYVGLTSCIIWLLSLLIFRISAVAALTSFTLTPIIVFFFTHDSRLMIFTVIVSLLIVIRHISNIKKLLEK